MAHGTVPDYALYYPDLMCCVIVDIYGVRLNASHNAMAASYENRNFLDVALWKELKEGNPLLEKTVAPHPPCKRLYGTRTDGGNVVIAMLKNQFKVTLVNAKVDIDGSKIKKGTGVDILLKNVLLVQNLPVPLHISARGRVRNTGAFDTKQGPDMKKENFPERYRDHAYWDKESCTYGPLGSGWGIPGFDFDKLSAALHRCMLEGDGKDARNELALAHGWHPSQPTQEDVESWEHEETGNCIEYFPTRDGAFLTLRSHLKDGQGGARGNQSNKYLHLDTVGGKPGLAKLFQNICDI